MSAAIVTLFTTYLIFPVMAILFAVTGAVIAKKSGLLKNKRLIIYSLSSVLILAAPALLGFLDYRFMPYLYIILAGAYFLAGVYNDRLLEWVFDKEDLKYRFRIIFTIFQVVVAAMLFAMIFNLCNELKYGFWASTSMLSFILASLLIQSYRLYVRIPTLIYKVWEYDRAIGYHAPENLDHSKLKVVSVELFKQESDTEPISINAKVPDEMLLGEWMKLLFEDYNKKSVHSPIDVYGEADCGWIFYVKTGILTPRRYLDFEQTVAENRIKEKQTIIAKRVKNIIIE